MRILRQPLIVGYILSGILIGPLVMNMLPQLSTLSIFSEIGIIAFHFIVGLHLSPRLIKEVGGIALITGMGQLFFTTTIGFVIGIALGFSQLTALYIALAISFSSTIIIMKLLFDKDALEKLYGKIAIGFLVVQDFVAIIVLLILSSYSTNIGLTSAVITTLLRGIIVCALFFPLTYYLLLPLSSFFAKSQEFLFLFAVAWGMGFASLFNYLGFPLEVGALIAGILLSITPYSYEISSKLRPLRDFLIIPFFMLLGAQIVFPDAIQLLTPAIVFSLLIIIGNPLIVMILMGIRGYSKNTGFMAGLTVAQISEFSLILIALGIKLGHIPAQIISLMTLIALITIAGCTYLIMFSDKIYPFLAPLLTIFERKKIHEKNVKMKQYHYFLLGENRIGFSIMKAFRKIKKEFLVIDFNPEVVKRLSKEGTPCIYGDVSSIDFLQEINLQKAKLIVSTIPDRETNISILDIVRQKNKSTIIILTARQITDALEFYNAGADYVVLPYFLGGEYTAHMIEKAVDHKRIYEIYKQRELRDIKERLKRGHEHPSIQKDVKRAIDNTKKRKY